MSHLSAAENTLHRTLRGESESRPYSDFSSQDLHCRPRTPALCRPGGCFRDSVSLPLQQDAHGPVWRTRHTRPAPPVTRAGRSGTPGIRCRFYGLSPRLFPWGCKLSVPAVQQLNRQEAAAGGPTARGEAGRTAGGRGSEQREAASAGSVTCLPTPLPFLAKPKSLSAPCGDSRTQQISICVP